MTAVAVVKKTITPKKESSQDKPFEITPTTAVAIGLLGIGAVITLGLHQGLTNLFSRKGRFGQGGASYENEQQLKAEIERVKKEINLENLTKDNVYYKNIANTLYEYMNNRMFAWDFGVVTKYTYFPKIVDLIKGLNNDELKMVVVEFGARPRSYLFEFGASGSLFDWFERSFTRAQLDQLSLIFKDSGLWRTPASIVNIQGLFNQALNKENANNWSTWIGNATSQSSDSILVNYTNRPPGYAVSGSSIEKIPVFAIDKSGISAKFDGTKYLPIDYFTGRSYQKPTLTVFNGIVNLLDKKRVIGATYILGEITSNVITESGIDLKGKIIMVDARYFNQTPPTQNWITKYKIE